MRTIEEVKNDMDNFSGKKTTKAYRALKNELLSLENDSQGLGDTVEKVLKATGITSVVKAIVGDDCGCKERKQRLNAILPYGTPKQIRCFAEEEIEKYTEFFNSRKKDSWTAEQVTFLFELYAGVFNKRYNIKRMCSSCMGTANILRGVTGDLDKVYKESI
tara:strand:- start:57 stop:539 length:483 start_codon:yes stop_codon:yes gene_type:complete